ncbi:MAG: hypothetical protein P0119_21995 [Nitrospira sp.]|nr:hypothetical protein [Nitrospira sp.]
MRLGLVRFLGSKAFAEPDVAALAARDRAYAQEITVFWGGDEVIAATMGP